MATITPTTGTISSAGIGSGLDVNSIVTQLMAVERQPLTRLQTTATTYQTQLSAFGQMQSLVSALQDAAKPLFSADSFARSNASSSDTTSVSASTTTKAVPGHLLGRGERAVGDAVGGERRRRLRRLDGGGRHRQPDDQPRHLGRRPDDVHAQGRRGRRDDSDRRQREHAGRHPRQDQRRQRRHQRHRRHRRGRRAPGAAVDQRRARRTAFASRSPTATAPMPMPPGCRAWRSIPPAAPRG